MSGRTRSRTTDFGTIPIQGVANNVVGWDTLGHTLDFPQQATVNWPVGTVVETTEDTVTPNFRRLLNDGTIVNNPFRRSRITTMKPKPGTFVEVYKYPSTSDTYCSTHGTMHPRYSKCKGQWGVLPPNGFLKPSDVTTQGLIASVKSLATTQSFANVSEADMLAYATAAESRKSVESVVNILNRVRRVAKNVRRLNVQGLKRELTPKELANRYMEARYAIRPMYYDATNLLAALQKQRGYKRETYRGYAEDSVTESQTLVNQTVYKGHILGTWHKKYTLTVSARAGVLCDVTVDALTPFGADRLPEAIWELLPFSFVVDWFANVGDVIAAHVPKAGINQLASWVTVKSTLTSEAWLSDTRSTWTTLYPGGSVIEFQVADSYQTYEESVLERFVGTTPSWAPQWDLHLDAFKVTDLAIILKNILR